MASGRRVGMLGLGAMGSGIALNLQRFLAATPGSAPLLVWNRTRAKADEVVAAGAQFADGGVAQVASACDVAFCMMFDDTSLLEVVEEYGRSCKAGACFVAMPTVHPDTMVKAAEQAGSAGLLFLACPVFGRPDAARNKALLCAVAGSAAAKEAARPYLDAIGRGTLDLGEDPKAASVQKLVGNFLIIGLVELLGEAMTVADKNGVSREQFLTFVSAFFPAPAAVGYATRMAHSDFSTKGGKEGFSVEGGIKDASLIKRLAEESGVEVKVVDAALEHLRRRKEEGGAAAADSDFASLVQVMRTDAGLQG